MKMRCSVDNLSFPIITSLPSALLILSETERLRGQIIYFSADDSSLKLHEAQLFDGLVDTVS